MTAKMHITIICILFCLWFFLALVLFYLFQGKDFSLILKAFSTFSPSLWWLAFKYLMKSMILYLLICIPVWFLYPVFLLKFKVKARNIMRDEFLRGQRIISEDELRKVILRDLKREFEEEVKKK